ncbi:reverse transcriptase domain-containing protein [Tanacetum coccineum]
MPHLCVLFRVMPFQTPKGRCKTITIEVVCLRWDPRSYYPSLRSDALIKKPSLTKLGDPGQDFVVVNSRSLITRDSSNSSKWHSTPTFPEQFTSEFFLAEIEGYLKDDYDFTRIDLSIAIGGRNLFDQKIISVRIWVLGPVHCVPKKGGITVVANEENELILTRLVIGWRVCIDYRKLNEATRKVSVYGTTKDEALSSLYIMPRSSGGVQSRLSKPVYSRRRLERKKNRATHESINLMTLCGHFVLACLLRLQLVATPYKYGYCKNIKKTVKTGQTQTWERKENTRAGRMLSKVMFEPVATDGLWQFEAPIKSWRLYKSCRVHYLIMEGMIIYMLEDVEYPLPKTTLQKMLDHKCEGRIVGNKMLRHSIGVTYEIRLTLKSKIFKSYREELLRACPHQGNHELNSVDTFYNGLNENEQDSLNAAAGGNLLSKTTREALNIIENKSKVRYSRNRSNASRMNATSSKTDERIDKLADQLSTLVEIVSKKVVTPAPVKAVEESCVTCGGAHSWYNCPATDNNQASVCATTGTYNQVNPPNRVSNQMAPPGFAPVQNNGQNRFNQNHVQGNNFNRGNNFHGNQGFQNQNNHAPNFQNQGFQNQPFQVPNNQVQQEISNDFSSYKRNNDQMLRNMQSQINSLKGDLKNEIQNTIKSQQAVMMNQQTTFQNNLQNMICGLFQNQASTSGTLPSNTIPNPKGEMKAITTRSGVAYEGPSIPTNPSPKKVVERETEEITDEEQTNFQGSTAQIPPSVIPISILKPDVLTTLPKTTPIPESDILKSLPKPNISYPSRRDNQKSCDKASDQMEKIFQIFQDLRFDISFTDALLLMPRFAPTIKSLLMNKEKLLENRVCEEYAPELLGFPNTSGGNPTPSSEPFTFEFILEEIEAYLKDDSISPEIDHVIKMLKTVFEDTNLVLNWEKCHFMCKEGIVLGHKISKAGIEVDRAKVDVIAKLPHPQCESVLGLRKVEAFYSLIHYASKTMTEAQIHYTTIEKEMLAVVYAFEKFQPYLVLSKSIVYTVQLALRLKLLWAFRTAWLFETMLTSILKICGEKKKLHDSKIKNRIFNVGDRVLLFNSHLKIFSGKFKTRWSGPFTITKVFPYGTVELSQPDGPNFKVNGHRVKHYFGGDLPPKDKSRSSTLS